MSELLLIIIIISEYTGSCNVDIFLMDKLPIANSPHRKQLSSSRDVSNQTEAEPELVRSWGGGNGRSALGCSFSGWQNE